MRSSSAINFTLILLPLLLLSGCISHNSKSASYDIEGAIYTDVSRNISIQYPVMKNFRGELLQDYMNQSFRKIVNIYSRGSYRDVKVDYTVTYKDNNYLSVIYEGHGTIEGLGKQFAILSSMNIDVGKSSNEINFSNFVIDETGLKKLLKKYHGSSVEYEGMRLYFSGSNVTFFFMPLDDMAKEFIRISVPKEELKPFVTWDFGERPVS